MARRFLFLLLLFPVFVSSEPREEVAFFNGKDLSGWKGNPGYWSVQDGAIVGHSETKIAKNEFIWSSVEVKDFYLSVEVKLEPNIRNAGIQFRSRSVNDHGQAQGYQADVGKNVWGRLYHEHGRGKLDWRGAGEKAVKPGDWNRYEILAVDDRIWTALNGTLTVSIRDHKADPEGHIALQIHSGPPQTVRYRNLKLIHDPEVALAGKTEAELNGLLIAPEDAPLKVAGILPRESVANRRKFGLFENGFALGDDPVVVLVGGTDVVKQSENGYLETLLTRVAGNKPVYVRNLAWQADTVYAQQRPRSFDTHQQLLERVDASIIISSFGQAECLDGEDRLPEFIAVYGKLLDEYSKKTRQIVLVTPHQFEKAKSDLLPDLTKHNQSVEAYGDAIRKLAGERKFLCVDLRELDVDRQTIDGFHLNDQGHWKLAFETVSQLTGASPVSGGELSETGTFSDQKLEALRQVIIKKNFLWHQHWRPTNWAFAFGNRQHVPSSHDHRPGKPRWMPKEIASIIHLIENAEAEIGRLNGEVK